MLQDSMRIPGELLAKADIGFKAYNICRVYDESIELTSSLGLTYISAFWERSTPSESAYVYLIAVWFDSIRRRLARSI